MQYTVRAFAEGNDERLNDACRIFPSMERSAYNLLRGGAKASTIKAVLRERYQVKNARWLQSSMNQARALMTSQEEGIGYRIEMCEEKVGNTREKMRRLSNPLKLQGCEEKIARLRTRIEELKGQIKEKSYPRAVFGSRELLHQLSTSSGARKDELKREWREKRSNHLFSVGQANQHGNGNSRLVWEDDDGSRLHLEVRNWPGGDFTLPLYVPQHWKDVTENLIKKAESVKLGRRGELLEGSLGLPYSIRVIRCRGGYQVLISFELGRRTPEWGGRLAGIDINPEGIACTVASGDGNLIAARFFRDDRLISASKNKRKWVLENLVNKMLRWARGTYGCNTAAVENLRFKGAFDYGSATNFVLSNFMKRKMLEKIKLSALKMDMLMVEVDPAYSSKVAMAKYGSRFGGFNRHQLAAFVIARRALGFGEVPVFGCLPNTKKEKTMWNHCMKHYGYPPRVQTWPRREPVERKSAEDDNGQGMVTELLTAPPAVTSSLMGLSHPPSIERIPVIQESNGQAGRVHPNRHANGGDGARGHRVHPPHPIMVASPPAVDIEDTVR